MEIVLFTNAQFSKYEQGANNMIFYVMCVSGVLTADEDLQWIWPTHRIFIYICRDLESMTDQVGFI